MKKLSLLALAVLACAAAPAMAATTTGTFNVTLTVQKACTVNTNDIAFGSHDFVEAGPVNVSSTINVKCTKGTGYTVALNKGVNGSSETARLMKDAVSGDTVPYSIANDSFGGINFGTTAGTKSGTGNGASQVITTYGQVLTSNLNVTPGNYSDVVTVSVTY